MRPIPHPRRIEGYAIVSEDGMLANAAGIMSDSLKFEAYGQFFERGLDRVDVVVHGRHSDERQPCSYLRHRLILTRQVPAIAADPSNEKALLWNPAGASLDEALAALGTPDGSVGVIGGTDAFGMFLDRYDFFHLSRAPGGRLPVGDRYFRTCPSGLRKKCWRAMASPPANGRCSIRQNAWSSSAGSVRQNLADKTAKV